MIGEVDYIFVRFLSSKDDPITVRGWEDELFLTSQSSFPLPFIIDSEGVAKSMDIAMSDSVGVTDLVVGFLQ